jgi:DNA-directed RNA polymerase I, II, and III subunit RPABC4
MSGAVDPSAYTPAGKEGVSYICGGARAAHARSTCTHVRRAPLTRPGVRVACADCGFENTLKSGDHVQCRECGYRILYKKRTKRSARPPTRTRARARMPHACC